MNKHGKILANQLSSVAVETDAWENKGDSSIAVVQGEQIHEIIYFQVIKIIARENYLHKYTILCELI